MSERLQKYLSRAGVASRRNSEKMITAGEVRVNGAVVRELGTKINPAVDTVTVNNRPVKPERNIYLLFNKPAGYVTTLHDPGGRPIITDLLKGISVRVYPVGRLDYQTEGLLLLTNDGTLTHALTHPSHEIQKTYRARVEGKPSSSSVKQMERGLFLSDGPTAPAKVRILESQGRNALMEITIHEGKNRQVRRMCEHIGHKVLQLTRVRLANLALKGLAPGKFRYLNRQEIDELKRIAYSNRR